MVEIDRCGIDSLSRIGQLVILRYYRMSRIDEMKEGAVP